MHCHNGVSLGFDAFEHHMMGLKHMHHSVRSKLLRLKIRLRLDFRRSFSFKFFYRILYPYLIASHLSIQGSDICTRTLANVTIREAFEYQTPTQKHVHQRATKFHCAWPKAWHVTADLRRLVGVGFVANRCIVKTNSRTAFSDVILWPLGVPPAGQSQKRAWVWLGDILVLSEGQANRLHLGSKHNVAIQFEQRNVVLSSRTQLIIAVYLFLRNTEILETLTACGTIVTKRFVLKVAETHPDSADKTNSSEFSWRRSLSFKGLQISICLIGSIGSNTAACRQHVSRTDNRATTVFVSNIILIY